MVRGNLNQRQVALEHRPIRNIFGQQHIHKLFQGGLQAHRAALFGVSADSHARDVLIFRGTNGKRVDVDGQPPGERRHAIQHARLVLHISNYGLHTSLDFSRRGGFRPPSPPYGSVAVSTSGLFGRRIISCSAAPAGTIGYTESSCSTRKSISTVCSDLRAASIVGTTSFRVVTVSPRIPNEFANAAKSGATSGVAT